MFINFDKIINYSFNIYIVFSQIPAALIDNVLRCQILRFS